MFTYALGSLGEVNRPLAIGVVRARQVSQETPFSDLEGRVAPGATRYGGTQYAFHAYIEISLRCIINTGNTLEKGRNRPHGRTPRIGRRQPMTKARIPPIAVAFPRRNLRTEPPELRVVSTVPKVSYRWLRRRNRGWFWAMLLGVLFGGLILFFTNLLSR
jgi:hypothetical protein